MSQIIPFHIDYVDNLGQGVSRLTDKICLLKRVLPHESGQGIIKAEQSKIIFADPSIFTQQSDRRIKPTCEHYTQCQGCHFLHTDYDYEQEIKHQAYAKLFRKWITPDDITYHKAPTRNAYRTRIQLHYDLKTKSLGLQTRQGILTVPLCELPVPAIKRKLSALYEQNAWLKLIKPSEPSQGHIELSVIKQDDHEVTVSINQPYAQGGFTQVNHEMNEQLVDHLHHCIPKSTTSIIDLFGGRGNLTKDLPYKTIVTDYIDQELVKPHMQDHQSYLQLNLYDKQALKVLKRNLKSSPDCLTLDPPRSGLKNISDFVRQLNPTTILYVSCSPNTLARDLKSIEKSHQLSSLHFYDFFPSTHHLEAFAVLSKLD